MVMLMLMIVVMVVVMITEFRIWYGEVLQRRVEVKGTFVDVIRQNHSFPAVVVLVVLKQAVCLPRKCRSPLTKVAVVERRRTLNSVKLLKLVEMVVVAAMMSPYKSICALRVINY